MLRYGEKYENSLFEAVKIKLNQLNVLFMYLINLIINNLYGKYGVPLKKLDQRYKPP